MIGLSAFVLYQTEAMDRNKFNVDSNYTEVSYKFLVFVDFLLLVFVDFPLKLVENAVYK